MADIFEWVCERDVGDVNVVLGTRGAFSLVVEDPFFICNVSWRMISFILTMGSNVILTKIILLLKKISILKINKLLSKFKLNSRKNPNEE